jgi:hypothetical protein
MLKARRAVHTSPALAHVLDGATVARGGFARMELQVVRRLRYFDNFGKPCHTPRACVGATWYWVLPRVAV